MSHRIESEKQELILALDDASASLDEEKNRTRRADGTITQIQQEMKKMIKAKDEEIDNAKKGQKQIIESLQVSHVYSYILYINLKSN